MTPYDRSSLRAPPTSRRSGRARYRLHQELIGLRRRHPWLHRARTTTLHLTNMALLYEVRQTTTGWSRL